MEIGHGEKVEAELNGLITRRHEQRRATEGERAAEEMYEESVRRYNAQRARERRAEWASYHRAAAERHRATLTDLVRFHEEAAERLDLGGDAA